MDRDDLDTPEKIRSAVVAFYRDVSKDDRLGPIFNQVAQVDWHAHLDLLTNYWCRILLRTPGYDGVIVEPHVRVNDMHQLESADFTRWYQLWTQTLDAGFAGPAVSRAKDHASKIASVLARRVAGVDWVPA